MSTGKESSACPDGYRALSESELRELLHRDDKMDQILRLNEKLQQLRVEREALQTSNRRLAEHSLARRPRLCSGKLQLAVKYRELSNLATTCREKQSQLGAGVQQQNLQTAQNLLQEEVDTAEERSEELLEAFMEGTVSLDRFLDRFQSCRRTCHARRAQAEKMQEAARAERPGGGLKRDPDTPRDPQRDSDPQRDPQRDPHRDSDPHRPNGFVAQGPLRVFQVRYGLTPAILLPHYPVAPPSSAPSHRSCTAPPEPGQTHILSTGSPMPGHGPPVGLRVIGQIPGGWPGNGRPVRVQQLYRPNPQQPEPPYR
ncbi:vacuolar protein sorting-associated protein 37D [Pseudoliparis swirei]|uniref:vacuolar protein sorting-associated protein 37D n=1 Tax=Pseudoliparis swirei TaxID=2059687 RepID=UPI0024BD7C76|nr:vacuolar protein sorting-associated protein 37D [Pseudoliparis swirei]